MKLIQALKQVKDLQRKADDLVIKIRDHSADLSHETPVYEDQRAQVASWVQAHGDIVREILRLRLCIQHTNMMTLVVVELDGKPITKSIAAWIHRRKDLAAMEMQAWKVMTDRGLREGVYKQTNGQEMEVRLRRYYDPRQRDEKLAALMSEPSTIDATLEVANAVTDLIEGSATEL